MSLLLAFAPAPSAIDEPEPRFVRQYPSVQIDTPPVWGQFLLVLSEIDFKLVSIDSGFHFIVAREPIRQIRLQPREDDLALAPIEEELSARWATYVAVQVDSTPGIRLGMMTAMSDIDTITPPAPPSVTRRRLISVNLATDVGPIT